MVALFCTWTKTLVRVPKQMTRRNYVEPLTKQNGEKTKCDERIQRFCSDFLNTPSSAQSITTLNSVSDVALSLISEANHASIKRQDLLNLQLFRSHFRVNSNYECPRNTSGKAPNLQDSMGHGKKYLLAAGSINKGLPERRILWDFSSILVLRKNDLLPSSL